MQVHADAALAERSRYAKIWLLHMDSIDAIKMSINAETYVFSGEDAPLVCGTIHNNYAKSVRLNKQQLRSLPQNYPWLYEQFVKKWYHYDRHSQRFW